MIIYVDVLLMVNFLVDFFLIKLTCFLSGCSIRLIRCLLAAVVSALFSLYIFLPPLNTLLEIVLKIIPAVLSGIICKGLKNFKTLMRWSFYLYSVSFVYAGVMLAINMLLKPQKLSVYNGVVYFNISPLMLISLSAAFYIIFVIVLRLSSKSSETAKRIDISLFFSESHIDTVAVTDNGHTLKDMFGNDLMIIIDKTVANKLFGDMNTILMLQLQPPITDDILNRYRLINVSTVAGSRLLPSIKIDKLILKQKSGNRTVNKVTAVITDNDFNDDYSCILPQIIEGDIL